MKLIFKIVFILMCCVSLDASAQEYLRPLNGNINLIYRNPVNSPDQNSQQEKFFVKNDTLPFFEDFYYAPNSPYPTVKHWLDSSVYVNTGFAIAPPSIGVATFDGLNKKGYPYNITATPISSNMADVLTSRPINLYSNPKKTYFYSPADSLGISFLYQARGFGENPASNDSLVLEFFKPLQTTISGTNVIVTGGWNKAWGTRGNNSPPSNDTIFKKGFVRIKDTAYFHTGFQFRFRNRATGAGSVDHWHLDYIDLRVNHYKTDTSYNDVTFGYMPRNILKKYTAMPYYQYNASEMDTSFTNFVRNNNVGVVKNTNYEYTIYNSAMAPLASYGTSNGNTSNVNPFCTRGWDSVSTHRNPPLNYTLTMNPLTKDTIFYIKHIVNTTPDVWKYNDTILQKIEFSNFYAYDDGSAESGYYHATTGAKDAIKYTFNVTDTLRALDVFFDPITDGNFIKNSTFRIYVWADGGNQPGTVLLKDSAVKPVYLNFGYNKIPRYFLTSPMVLNPGNYYIGMQQVSNQPLYVGFDRNLNHMTKLYYDVGFGWTQSAIPGSLMIHPVMGEAKRALVGINEPSVNKKQKEGIIKVYPNPASDKLFISAASLNNSDNYKIELYSIIGDKLFEIKVENSTTEVNLNEYASGIYFVALKQNNNTISTQKFIISR